MMSCYFITMQSDPQEVMYMSPITYENKFLHYIELTLKVFSTMPWYDILHGLEIY